MKKLFLGGVLVFLLAGSAGAAGDYSFDYTDKNDMRGAFQICAITGFVLGDCPKVLTKCWQPPMLYFYRKHGRWKYTSECTRKSPSFFMSNQDVSTALNDATAMCIAGGSCP